MTEHTPISEAFDRIADSFRADRTKAHTHFTVESRQVQGLRSEVQARDFLLTVDEPKALGGTDAGPNPVELVLAGLAACQEVTYRLYADKLGIPLKSVSVTAEGDIDLCGLFAVDPSARPGFRGIELKVELDSDAPQAELDRLKRTVDAHCPVLDVLRNATPILARSVREGSDVESSDFSFAGLAG